MFAVFEFPEIDKWDIIEKRNAFLNLLQFSLRNQWMKRKNIHKQEKKNKLKHH